ncbi:spore germination protein GerPE [Paenibacillus sp. RC67]|uniref:spore germination protein GerPE n=1 Tax=Paenibacillus sp. RC67 TaxID=3039392 RepID=UPI0024ADA2AE|nr:spore germination protein GerPE [Paenibacillus sp. RC67]
MKRWSVVEFVKVFNLSEASIIQVGDNNNNHPISKVIAVQRQVADFNGDEGNFEQFPLFKREIPLPAIHETVQTKFDNACDTIRVGTVTILGIAGSSVLQIGTNETIEAEARVKQFRQYVTGKPNSPTKNKEEQEKDEGK